MSRRINRVPTKPTAKPKGFEIGEVSPEAKSLAEKVLNESELDAATKKIQEANNQRLVNGRQRVLDVCNEFGIVMIPVIVLSPRGMEPDIHFGLK